MREVSLAVRKMEFAARCGLGILVAFLAVNGLGVASAADESLPRNNDRPGTADGLAAIRPIAQISTDIRLGEQKLPPDNAQELFGDSLPHSRAAVNRSDWPELAFWWAPTEFSHWPLYFDDVPLERYGQTSCRLAQPGLSGVHFFGNVALLPYEMLVDLPCSRITQLGYHRPGSCTPAVRERLRVLPDPAIWSHLHR